MAASKFSSTAAAFVAEQCGHLVEIWAQIGLEEDEIDVRGDEVMQHVVRLLETIVSQEREGYESMQESVSEDMKTLHSLSRELEVECEPPASSLPLVRQDEQLGDAIAKLREERERRLESIIELESRLQTVQTSLVLENVHEEQTQDNDLSLSRIQQLECRVTEFEQELQDRKEAVRETMAHARALWDDLERKPTSAFEDVFLEGLDSFPLSPANIHQLQRLREQLIVEEKDAQAALSEERAHVEQMWNTMNVDEATRAAFLANMSGCGPSAFAAFEAEAARLKELRRKNLATFVDAARLRLEEAFEKSCFGQAQRESYAAFASQDVSEEALRDLEAAIKDVEGYFEAHSKLLTLVNKHRTLMKKVAKMAASRRKSRLNNRGGALLKEEKLRKATEQELPRVEKELTVVLKAWKRKHGDDFLVEDEPYLQKSLRVFCDPVLGLMQPPSPPKHLGHREGINERNAREKAAKQAELEEKKRERKRKIEEEMRYGTVPLTPKHKTRAAARTPGVRRETPARTPASRARVASKTPVSAKQKGKPAPKRQALKQKNGYGDNTLLTAFEHDGEVRQDCEDIDNFSHIGTFDDFEHGVPMRSSVLTERK